MEIYSITNPTHYRKSNQRKSPRARLGKKKKKKKKGSDERIRNAREAEKLAVGGTHACVSELAQFTVGAACGYHFQGTGDINTSQSSLH